MPFYESIFIVRQDIPAAQVEILASTFADIVRNQGGQVKRPSNGAFAPLPIASRKTKKAIT